MVLTVSEAWAAAASKPSRKIADTATKWQLFPHGFTANSRRSEIRQSFVPYGLATLGLAWVHCHFRVIHCHLACLGGLIEAINRMRASKMKIKIRIKNTIKIRITIKMKMTNRSD
jgi:hypothetical protein